MSNTTSRTRHVCSFHGGKAKFSLSMILLITGILCIVPFVTPALAQEGAPYHSKGVKGLYEVDIFTKVTSREVVEETSPGEDFKGDAVSTRVMARLGVKPLKPVELFIQAGAANLNIDDFNGYRGDYTLTYGGGLNLTLYEDSGPNRFRIKAFGEALTFTTDDRIRTIIQSQDVLVKEEIRWLEYAAGVTGTWRVQNVDPYIGVKFSWLDSHDDIKDPRVGKIALEEDSNIGIVGGADIYIDPKEVMAVNMEASLLDEASFKIGIKLWY